MKIFGPMQRPQRSDLRLVLVYWLLAAPIIFYTYQREHGAGRGLLGILYTVTLDSAAVYLLVYGFLPRALGRQNSLSLLAGLVGFALIDAHLYWLGYQLLFSARPLQWDFVDVLRALIQHTQSYGLLGILLAGKRYFDVQQSLLLTQKAQAESELRNLKAQIDPHFLFNNLNVLRGLIQQDPAVANEYLNRFAALYRFLIRHKDEDFVSLREELQFADEYIYLLRHRFGAAYAFGQELPVAADLDALLVVPGTLQQLLENAVKHNAGDEDDPLRITIRACATSLSVRHERRPKLTPVDSTGTGLANLRERYQLLTHKAITVESSGGEFVVSVPVLRATRAE